MAKILVIDDESAIRDVLSVIVKAAGHEIRTAATGAEGVELYRDERPDVVVTDIIMPKQDGVETIKVIRDIDPSAKIIAISGGGGMGTRGYMPESIQTTAYLTVAEQQGADRTLTKPFNRAEFLAVLDEVLTSPGA